MRVLVFLVVSGLAHFLAARWVLSTLPPAKRLRLGRAILMTAAILSLLLGTARLVAMAFDTAAMRTVIAACMLELGAVVITLVPIGLMTLVTRGVSRALAARRPTPDGAVPTSLAITTPADLVSRRQAVERAAGAALFGATGTALGWGMIRGRHAFELEEVVVRVKNWPRALDGYTIAQVSDVHVGVFVGDRELDEGFELIRRFRPDLVVATGDLVDFDSTLVSALAARLIRVGARDGACAILGNHDHYAGPADVLERLRAMNVRALSNESVHLRAGDGGGFALLGVDDIQGRAGRSAGFHGPDLYAAGRGLDPELPRILLAHQPSYFKEAAGRVALQLSGHTHGGQINPGFRPADLVMDFVAGRYERQESTLWVNRGFGVAGPPSRLGAPPEVTKIVIVAA